MQGAYLRKYKNLKYTPKKYNLVVIRGKSNGRKI